MFSGFQSNSFQSNSFQIVQSGSTPPVDNGWLGGKAYSAKKHKEEHHNFSYTTNYQKYLADKEKLAELEKLIDKKVQLVHNKSEVEAFDAANADALYEVAVAQAQQEIKQLLIMRNELYRLIDEEECVLVLLLSQPFVN